MLANIFGISFLIVWGLLVIRSLVKESREAKRTGVPKGCTGCATYKKGMCAGHTGCSSAGKKEVLK